MDESHRNPVIITSDDYTDNFRASLHEYVRDGMDMAMERIR